MAEQIKKTKTKKGCYKIDPKPYFRDSASHTSGKYMILVGTVKLWVKETYLLRLNAFGKFSASVMEHALS